MFSLPLIGIYSVYTCMANNGYHLHSTVKNKLLDVCQQYMVSDFNKKKEKKMK